MACPHLNYFFENQTNKLAVKRLVSAVVFPLSEQEFKLKASFICKKCPYHKSCLSDSMVCAHCIFSACRKNGHIKEHYIEKGHQICVSLELGEMYCNECRDYQYHEYSEQIIKEFRRLYFANFAMFDLSWRPEIKDLHLLKYVTPLENSSDCKPTRGLVNMGNTCFLNVVIQALTHTPALRDFLLSDLHRCPSAKQSRNCLACEMIRITQEIYKPVSAPYALTNLLYVIWSQVQDLAGYNQHDAHELFLAILSLLHNHLSEKSLSSSASRAPAPGSAPLAGLGGPDSLAHQHAHSHSHQQQQAGALANSAAGSNGADLVVMAVTGEAAQIAGGADASRVVNGSSRSSSTGLEDDCCDCIVHQAFMATLESKIVYDCGVHTSRHLEIFRDLSLEIFREDSVSLEASFRSYFGTERMKDALCSTCLKLGATKQYSLFQLPNIFSVHLKRCHAKSKVTTKVHFPEELDLAPFISSKESDKSLWEDKYSLYSVINHRGQNSSGHYTVYVRTEANIWCLCDDQNVHLVTISEVLRSDAYMLFYHKNSLVMKAN